MILYTDYEHLTIKERMDQFIPDPIESLNQTFRYEETKISGELPSIEFKDCITTTANLIEPFVKGGINFQRQSLEFLNLSRKGFLDYLMFTDFDNYEDFLEDKLEQDKNELNQVDKSELTHFYIENFGFDFKDLEYETSSFLFSDLTRNNETDEFRTFEEDKINYGLLVNHISGLKLLYKKPYIHSKRVRIEIRPEENEKTDLTISDIIGYVSSFLKSTPFYVERSVFWDGKAVMYFEFDKYINDAKKKQLEGYFQTYHKISIHLQRKEEFCILPLSSEYLIRGSYDINHKLKVHQLTFNEVMTQVKNRTINSVSEIENLIGSVDVGIVVQKISKDRENSTSSQTLENSALSRFSYGRGTRYSNQCSLAMFCAKRRVSTSQFTFLAKLCNIGNSRDMQKWKPNTIDTYLSRLFNNTLNKVIDAFDEKEAGPDENSRKTKKKYDIKDNASYTWLDNEYAEKEFIEVISKEYNKTHKKVKQRGTWKEHFLKDCSSFVKFILRQKNYNDDNNFTYEEGFEKLKEGVLISKSMLSDLSKYLHIKSDIRKVMNFLTSLGILEKIQINGYTYSRKIKVFAVHFKPISSLLELKKLIIILKGYTRTSQRARILFTINNIIQYNTKQAKNNKIQYMFFSINYVVNVHKIKKKINSNLINKILSSGQVA